MLHTVLNLGVNAETVKGLVERTGNERFALDTWLKFCRMYATIVLNVSQHEVGVSPQYQADPGELRSAIESVHRFCKTRNTPIAEDPKVQLRHAIEAVFHSWRSHRASVYRLREGIPENLGTAVVVQAMVFGNMGNTSGAGVAFSRNPSTGANEPCGDFLLNAQGEDVVSGARRTERLAAMARDLPLAHRELLAVLRRLERHYADLCEVEFTVQNGRLHILQNRSGKCSAVATTRVAVEMARDPDVKLSRREAVKRVTKDHLRQLKSLTKVKSDAKPAARGVATSPGVAAGMVCTSPDRVVQLAATGSPVILVRPTISPEDVKGIAAASAIVTSAGGIASHTALVARSWGIPAVCGAADVVIGVPIKIGAESILEGDVITIDGDLGAIYCDDQREPSCNEPEELRILRIWASELGIEFGGEPAKEIQSESDTRSVTQFEVVRALQLRGYASVDEIAVSLLTTIDVVSAALVNLDEEFISTAPRGLHVTALGREWLAGELADERQRLDQEQLRRIYLRFMELDEQFKRMVTEWQVKNIDGKQTPNDHKDADYDLAVLRRVAALHDEIRRFLVHTAVVVPRLERYLARLDRAAAYVAKGDASMIASPLKDSYHRVWFELHEELISLSGRDRMTEEQRHN
jgi:pyruvate,orthophosphate dikinase